MSRLSKKSKEQVAEILLGELDSIIADPETPLRDKIKSIELVGREFGLFTERKQINVDIQSIVHQLTDRQLEVISGEVGGDRDYIDVHPRVVVGASAGPEVPSGAAAEGDSGDQGSGPEDEHGVDQAVAPED